MRAVINDANILIDLAKLELLDAFSTLTLDLYSTDFVIEELNNDQRLLVNELIAKNRLFIIQTDDIADLVGISDLLENSSGLSFEDCSVWYYSKKKDGILLTGDGRLRKQARKDDVEVKGILYVFDQLLEQEIITYDTAIEKMQELTLLNVRLPQAEIDKRLHEWGLKNNL